MNESQLKDLLRRYITHVVLEEGCDFLRCLFNDKTIGIYGNLVFTDAEIKFYRN